MALEINNKKLYSIINTEVKKKFDGDTEILWDMIKDKKVNTRSVSEYLNDNYNRDNSILSIQEIEEVPLLNILFCENFYKYYGEKEIRVTYVPLSQNDIDTETITAYDSELNEFIISTEITEYFIVGCKHQLQK